MSDVLRPTSCGFGAAETKPQVRRLPDTIHHQTEPQKDTPDPAQRITPSPTRSHTGHHHSQRQTKPQKRPLCSDGNARPSAAAAAAPPTPSLSSPTGVGDRRGQLSFSFHGTGQAGGNFYEENRSPKPSFPAPLLMTALLSQAKFCEKKF